MRSSTSASSAGSANRSARRPDSRCRRASASRAGARSRGATRPERGRRRTARALRLRGHRHLRGVRAVRDGVPGRHRDRQADQGAARDEHVGSARAARRCNRGEATSASRRAPFAPGCTLPMRCTPRSARVRCRRSPARCAPAVGRPYSAVDAGDAARSALRSRRRQAAVASASSTSRAARRARWARRAATTVQESLPTVTERVLRRAGLDVVLSARPRRAVLRPAVRQQGSRGERDEQGRRARVGAARRERRTAACRSCSTPAPAPTG